MSANRQAGQRGRRKVERALEELLATYSACAGCLSPWECHCLSHAMVFSSHGYFDKALIEIAQVLEPPCPLPAFANRQSLTVEDVRHHLRALQQSD